MFKKHEPALRGGTGVSAAGRPSRRSLFFLLLALGVALALSMGAFADDAEAKKKKTKPFTQTSTPAQSGATLVDAHGAPINGTPFTFSNTAKIRSLSQATITLTIIDGDTGVNNADRDDLILELDGISTGIELNQFSNNQQETHTITGTLPPDRAAQILAQLKADRQLDATIRDRDADTVDAPNSNTVSLPATSNTTLTLKGAIKK